MPHAFFVYGTLKRGQANYPLLAPHVRAVTSATTRGQLCDFGPFPGMVAAEGVVKGELIAVAPSDLPAVLAIVDDLEGYDPADPVGSMYVRRVVSVQCADGTSAEAYAYFYNRDPQGLTIVPAGEWSGPSTAVAAEDAEMAVFKEHVRSFLGRAQPNE